MAIASTLIFTIHDVSLREAETRLDYGLRFTESILSFCVGVVGYDPSRKKRLERSL